MLSSVILAAALLGPTAEPKLPYSLGYLPLTAKERTAFAARGVNCKAFLTGVKADLPPKFELKWAPRPHPVGQGNVGSCMAWALAYAAKSCLEARESGQVPSTPESYFSPSFIYSLRANKPEQGMNPANACDLMKNYGCVPFTRMPYLDSRADDPPDTQEYPQASMYQIAAWSAIDEQPYVETIKKFLTFELPVLIGVMVTQEFMQIQGDAVFSSFDPNSALGGHAMCIVGYDDQRKAFRVLNSWGLNWADHGYCWISYSLFEQKADDTTKRFLLDAFSVFDAPNVWSKVAVNDAGNGRYSWSIGLQGGPEALGQIEAVEYIMPAGFEPLEIRRTASDGGGQAFALRSADVQPNTISASLRIWMQICLKGSGLKVARPVLVPCAKSQEPAPATGRAAVPPSWLAGQGAGPTNSRPAAASTTEATVIVPNVSGMSSGLAVLRLKSLGLDVKVRHAQETSARGRLGSISEQSPAPGTKVPRGSVITVIIP